MKNLNNLEINDTIICEKVLFLFNGEKVFTYNERYIIIYIDISRTSFDTIDDYGDSQKINQEWFKCFKRDKQ